MPERLRRLSTWQRMVALLLLVIVVGVVAALIWSRVTTLPEYTVAEDGSATTTEMGLTQYFSGDAWFSLLGVIAGVLIGLASWWLFARHGWPVVVVAIAAGIAAALITWGVGTLLGPSDFAARISAAQPGDAVPIDLTLRAPVSLLVWPFVATIPVLLWSSLGPDEEEPRPLIPAGWRRRRHESVAGITEEDQQVLAELEAGDDPDQRASSST